MFVSSPAETRVCSRCRLRKPASCFGWHRKDRGQLDTYCRGCRAAYKREHYAANRARYIANAHRRKQAVALERATRLVEIFRRRPCVDCGESDPLVLEFDHLGEKRFNIAKGLRSHSWEAILDEIAKCEVVCANCHRRRTAHRGGFARAAVAQR
jgi:hypothetical protein